MLSFWFFTLVCVLNLLSYCVKIGTTDFFTFRFLTVLPPIKNAVLFIDNSTGELEIDTFEYFLAKCITNISETFLRNRNFEFLFYGARYGQNMTTYRIWSKSAYSFDCIDLRQTRHPFLTITQRLYLFEKVK